MHRTDMCMHEDIDRGDIQRDGTADNRGTKVLHSEQDTQEAPRRREECHHLFVINRKLQAGWWPPGTSSNSLSRIVLSRHNENFFFFLGVNIGGV